MSVSIFRLYRWLGPVDVRNVRRDPLLMWVTVLPFMMAIAYRLFVPWLRETLLRSIEFDLAPYYTLIASTFLTAAPGLVGMVAGFLLLDERDDGVLTAIAVTPVAPATFIGYRVSAPMLVGLVMTVLAWPIVGLTRLATIDLVAAAAVAAPLAPITALFLATFAQNKVSGFAMVKVLNTVNFVPVTAWFIVVPWQWLAGIVPAYWPMKMVWLAVAGHSYGAYALAGLAIAAGWLVVLLRRFSRRSW